MQKHRGFHKIRGTFSKAAFRGNMGLCRDSGKENGSYQLGFRVWGFPKIKDRFWGSL